MKGNKTITLHWYKLHINYNMWCVHADRDRPETNTDADKIGTISNGDQNRYWSRVSIVSVNIFMLRIAVGVINVIHEKWI